MSSEPLGAAGCPATDTLRRVAAAEAPPGEESQVRDHLNGCAACRERFERALGTTAEYFALPDENVELTAEELRELSSRCLPLGVNALQREDGVELADGLGLPPPRGRPFLARLGPYDVVSVRGKGGMGLVLKGYDSALQRYVALKVMLPSLARDEAARCRFLREARTAAGLRHANVVAVHAVHHDADPPYLVMEYVAGRSLASLLAAEPLPTPQQAAEAVRQVLLALEHAHQQGVIHRDVKPANVLVEEGSGAVKLVDFGLARAVAEAARLTAEGMAMGTPWYMAPEQARGSEHPDGRSDLFSVGVLLFEMLSGTVPFPGRDPHEVMFRLATEDAPDVRARSPEVPEAMAAIVRRALRRDPAARYASASAFLEALDAFLAAPNRPQGAAVDGPPAAPVAGPPPATSCMRVILEVAKGPLAGRCFEFDRHDTLVVGRSKRAQLRIAADPYFSRHHFMIEVNPPRCFLRDLGSTNGTFVNGQKLGQAHLGDGDVVHGGRTEIRVRVAGATPIGLAEGLRSAPPTAGRVRADMDAVPLGTFAPRPDPTLRCRQCGAPAREAAVAGLAQTGLVAYACRRCHEKHCDAGHPVVDYEVARVAGHGPLGPICEARRVSTGTAATLRVLPPHMTSSPQAVDMFLRQMRLGAQLRHPNIVPVLEMGQSGDTFWIATEHVAGIDAGQLAGQPGGSLAPGDAVPIAMQVLEALDYAHGLGLVHRDVKPTNVFVSGGPGARLARLADFALMRAIDDAGLSGITREGECRGTVAFMPPEQVLRSRQATPACDVYGAGATLYWLLTGHPAYDFEARDARGEPKDPFLVILEDPVVPLRRRNPAVPAALAQVVEKALAREPADRYRSARAMQQALAGLGY